MNAEQGGAPAWLFSFVDLAFLMLIAMTQLAGDVAQAPDLGEMIVPSINEQSAPGELATGSDRVWQLRIHPRAMPDEAPFELISPSQQQADAAPYAGLIDTESEPRVALEDLIEQLDSIMAAGSTKPLLVPHEDSRSQDLLDAVALMEDRWPSRRRALVARLAEI
jgi:hypothetical protein